MKPIEFPEQNEVVAKDQPQYAPLPAFVDRWYDKNAQPVIFCMGLSFRERVKLLFTGRLWVSLLTFGKPLQPSKFSVDKEDMQMNERMEYRRDMFQ